MRTNPYIPDPKRFELLESIRQLLPEFSFGARHTFTLRSGQELLITDPSYIAEVYQSPDDEAAVYVRSRGVFVSQFGGDFSCPVWWIDPFLILPVAVSSSAQRRAPKGATVMAKRILCDSGSYVFLPVTRRWPQHLRDATAKVVADGHGARVRIPPGRYRVVYDQLGESGTLTSANTRNIVAWRQ